MQVPINNNRQEQAGSDRGRAPFESGCCHHFFLLFAEQDRCVRRGAMLWSLDGFTGEDF